MKGKNNYSLFNDAAYSYSYKLNLDLDIDLREYFSLKLFYGSECLSISTSIGEILHSLNGVYLKKIKVQGESELMECETNGYNNVLHYCPFSGETSSANSLSTLPSCLTKTLTYDRGKEMTEHAKFTAATQMKVYFCDPHSPWQRGSNENTNGLLRGFFPKGTDFNQVNKKDLLWAQEALNERPRETLGYRTPKEKLNALILEHQKMHF